MVSGYLGLLEPYEYILYIFRFSGKCTFLYFVFVGDVLSFRIQLVVDFVAYFWVQRKLRTLWVISLCSVCVCRCVGGLNLQLKIVKRQFNILQIVLSSILFTQFTITGIFFVKT